MPVDLRLEQPHFSLIVCRFKGLFLLLFYSAFVDLLPGGLTRHEGSLVTGGPKSAAANTAMAGPSAALLLCGSSSSQAALAALSLSRRGHLAPMLLRHAP